MWYKICIVYSSYANLTARLCHQSLQIYCQLQMGFCGFHTLQHNGGGNTHGGHWRLPCALASRALALMHVRPQCVWLPCSSCSSWTSAEQQRHAATQKRIAFGGLNPSAYAPCSPTCCWSLCSPLASAGPVAVIASITEPVRVVFRSQAGHDRHCYQWAIDNGQLG